MFRARHMIFLMLLPVAAAAAQAQLTPAARAQTTVPRPEYPRPEFVRAEWMNLNGPWDFAIDQSDTGEERGQHLRLLRPAQVRDRGQPFRSQQPVLDKNFLFSTIC